MRKPMTTEEVQKKYRCWNCRVGKFCGRDCVEDCTCSTRCRHCGERIWFFGLWGSLEIPDCFDCPYCGLEEVNPYLK